MKLIIDISEEVYNEYMNLAKGRIPTYKACDIADVLKNGTPLPKGHGRLIDENDLVYEDLECTDGNTYMVVHAPYVDNAPTIIEADKE